MITGVEDSPTLQATAKEFAPSHTAFALAERENLALSSVESSDSDNDGEDDDDDVAPVSMIHDFHTIYVHRFTYIVRIHFIRIFLT